MVGALVVRSGRVVGEGFHRRAGGPHAERIALKRAGSRARGGTLVVSLEPCAHTGRTGPCVEGILQAGIRRVVAGPRDPNPKTAGKGFARLRGAGLQVRAGLLAAESRRINPVFFTWMTHRRPYVTLKAAFSADGRMTRPAGQSPWISGAGSRRWTQRLRAGADGILVGVGTVLRDDPQLTVRGRASSGPRPLKVVLDSRLRTPLSARLFRSGGPVWIAAGRRASKRKARALQAAGAEVLRFPEGPEGIRLAPVLKALARREVTHLLVEGGPKVAGSFLRGGWIDQLFCVVAPEVIGGGEPFEKRVTGDLLRRALSAPNRIFQAIGPDWIIGGAG